MNQLHWQNNRNTNNYRLLFAHLDNRQLRHVEVSGDVRADHRFKVLGCVFRERFWDINAGIVDEEINALEVPHSRISDPGKRSPFTDVTVPPGRGPQKALNPLIC